MAHNQPVSEDMGASAEIAASVPTDVTAYAKSLPADSPVQYLDMLRRRRLRDAQAFLRPAEVEFLGDGLEIAKVSQLHD
jgi:hypothetical protein